MMEQPIVKVGILTAPAISVEFHGDYTDSLTGGIVSGHLDITDAPHGIRRIFSPVDSGADSCFELADVTIGVDFHWQRKEHQRFGGQLMIIDGLTAVNLVSAEEYLKSVISSEMNSAAHIELLKAHAVISRSWLMAMLSHKNTTAADDRFISDDERIEWWDREDHSDFDVCADDHCQRYQGITRMSQQAVTAVESTRGTVLTDPDNGKICDARFSKCCGGAFELFENCWAPQHHSYLEAARDNIAPVPLPDLTVEANAARWIAGSPEAFCNTRDTDVLDQVLNSYDRETPDFYRWEVSFTRHELADLIRRRTAIDFGDITALEPLARGTSGRIYRLRIRGTRKTVIIGKELAIRRALSESHLYSSAFIVSPHEPEADGVPAGFTLHGAGWGHGVGLCQIGAAMMARQGYSYTDILRHYYHDANLTKLY